MVDDICYDEACNLEPWRTNLNEGRTVEMAEGDWMKRRYTEIGRNERPAWNAWTVVACISICLWIVILALVV